MNMNQQDNTLAIQEIEDGYEFYLAGVRDLSTAVHEAEIWEPIRNYYAMKKSEQVIEKCSEALSLFCKRLDDMNGTGGKPYLTIHQASKHFGIGEKKIRQLVDEHPNANFYFRNGVKVMIQVEEFKRFCNAIASL